MSSKIGFLNHVSTHPEATDACFVSINKTHPTSPVVLSVDGLDNFKYYTDKIMVYTDVEWIFNKNKLGYPPYDRYQILEWLKRTYLSVLKLNTDYFMMVEDDLFVLNNIKLDPEWQCVGHVITEGNKIHPLILEEIERISKVKPKTDYYGAGGGSIFKSSTFINNYQWVTDYIKQWWSLYELHYHPECVYMDCYMVLYYMLCGKDYTPNNRLLNLWPVDNNSTDKEIKLLYSKEYDIVHNIKSYY